MQLLIEKSLDPVQDAQFNDKHPRAAAGNVGLRPGQFAPKSEADKMRDEAEEEAEAEAEQEADAAPPPAESTTVQVGESEDAAEEAVAKDHADNLRKSTVEAEEPKHNLIVVFGDRADATKFAIACDHVMQNAAALRVSAEANGKYHVAPEGLSAAEIDRIQALVHQKTPLSEMTLEKAGAEDQEPRDEEEETLEKSAHDLLLKSVASGAVTEINLDQVLAIARTVQSLPDCGNGFLAVAEAMQYGSVRGMVDYATASGSPEIQARAGQIIKALCDAHLSKGATMNRQLLLLPVNHEQPPVQSKQHDATENDGKALPLGTKERVTAKVGSEENITEKTAQYPRTGHKADRKPRLILKG